MGSGIASLHRGFAKSNPVSLGNIMNYLIVKMRERLGEVISMTSIKRCYIEKR